MPVITTLIFNAAVTGTHGWSCGHAFKKGDLPTGQTLLGLQLNIKNYWPDGSAKFGILSGQTAITSGSPATVTLQTGPAAAGTSLSLADLKATGITAAIDCGTFGSASWAGTDWDTPLEVWFTGPLASSWRYRKAVGSDPHLSAWLELRLWAGGAVEVLQWVENSTILTAGITNKAATYSFTLGGAPRFSAAIDLPNRCRTPLLSGTALSYYLGTDPGVTVRHNAAYFSATKLVPAYGVAVPDGSAAISGLPTTFSPLQQGSWPLGMGTAGYHQSIGIMPGADATYIANSTSPIPWAGLQRNAYSVGRYGIHWRDEATNLPAQYASYPTHSLGDNSGVADRGSSTTGSYFAAGSGTAPATWKVSHCPSVGYLAYLVTGRKYHAETTQFAAVTAHFRTPNAWRQNELGILRTDENSARTTAWGLRSLLHAAVVTPDADSVMKSQFVGTLANNASWYHGQYVALSNNPQGFTREMEVNSAPNNDSYTPGAGPYTHGPWLSDFINGVVGKWKALEIPLGSGNDAKLDAFYAWKVRSTVDRFGGAGANEYLYRDAAVRTLAVAPNDSANWLTGAGPWFSNWGEMYNATWVDNTSEPGLTYGTGYTGPMIFFNGTKPVKEIGDGSLRGQEGIADATGLWGDLMPALAYAVSNGVPGAQAAWDLMTSAPNFGSFYVSATSAPVWAVVPHALSTPVSPNPIQGSSIRIDSTPLVSGAVVIGVPGLGVLGIDVPSSGTDGPAISYDKLNLPYDNDVEIRTVLTYASPGLVVNIEENGATELTVTQDGVYTFITDTYKAGILFEFNEVHTVNVGNPITLVAASNSSSSFSGLGAILQSHNLVGSLSSSNTVSTNGALENSIVLAGSTCNSTTSSSGASISQSHNLAATSNGSNTFSTSGAVNFINVLTGSNSIVNTFSTTGQIQQSHNLLGANSISFAISKMTPIYGIYGKIKSVFIAVGDIGLRPFN